MSEYKNVPFECVCFSDVRAFSYHIENLCRMLRKFTVTVEVVDGLIRYSVKEIKE